MIKSAVKTKKKSRNTKIYSFFLQMSKKSITFAAVFNTQTLEAMKNHIFSIILAAVCCAFAACNQNTPDDTKRGGDTATSLHQPSDPATWSPVGHKYVSADEDYQNREITFLSKDTFLWLRDGDERKVCYRLEYPTIYVWEDEHPWLKFVDTLTISRKSDFADESSCYKLVY